MSNFANKYFQKISQFITLNTIIGNGKSYEAPIYQRDYSWDKDDWEDLWNGIIEIPTENTHYLGCLVLQPIKDGGILQIQFNQMI